MKKIKIKWKIVILSAAAAVLFFMINGAEEKKEKQSMGEERKEIIETTVVTEITDDGIKDPVPLPEPEETDRGNEGEADVLPDSNSESAAPSFVQPAANQSEQEQAAPQDENVSTQQQGEDIGEFDPPA